MPVADSAGYTHAQSDQSRDLTPEGHAVPGLSALCSTLALKNMSVRNGMSCLSENAENNETARVNHGPTASKRHRGLELLMISYGIFCYPLLLRLP